MNYKPFITVKEKQIEELILNVLSSKKGMLYYKELEHKIQRSPFFQPNRLKDKKLPQITIYSSQRFFFFFFGGRPSPQKTRINRPWRRTTQPEIVEH
jgi:hypothetical protein